MVETRVAPKVGEVLDEAARVLQAARVPSPRSTARSLWAVLAGEHAGRTWLERGNEASPGIVTRYRASVSRLARGEPFAYVAGSAGFRSLEVGVDQRVLIPRPETEGLVECVLRWARARFEPAHGCWGAIADVGTGSGAIALSLAVEGRFERVVATDVSEGALAVATENQRRLCPGAALEFRLGAFCEPLEPEHFVVIVSNPPYLTNDEFRCLDPSVRNFEPRGALVSGEDGLVHTKRLLEDAKQRLEPGGLLAIELDSQRASEARSLALRLGWDEVTVRTDLFGRFRYLLAVRELW